MRTTLLATCLVLLFATPVCAEDFHVSNGGIYAGLSYFTPLTDSGFHDFLYPELGYTWDVEQFHLDVSSNFAFLVPDLIISAMRFLAGTDALPPLWHGLNNGDENPGRMLILSSAFRYSVLGSPGHKLDVGGLFDAWWMSPEVGGKRFGNIVWNVAPSVGYGFGSKAISVNLVAEAGNGFSGAGAFNPFVGLQAVTRIRLGRYLGIYVRAHVRQQNFDYSSFESNDSNYPPELFDVRVWETLFAADAGLIISTGKSKAWW